MDPLQRILETGSSSSVHARQLGAFEPWLEALWPVLSKFFRMERPLSVDPLHDSLEMPFKFQVSWQCSEQDDFPVSSSPSSSCESKPQPSFNATLKASRRLTAEDHFQNVTEYTLQLNDDSRSYASGDIIDIFPKNELADVDALIQLFGWQTIQDAFVKINPEPRRPDSYMPAAYAASLLSPHSRPTRLKELLLSYLQISHWTPPSPSFFQTLAAVLSKYFAPMSIPSLSIYIDKAQALGKKENLDDWNAYCWKPRRRVMEILFEFIRPILDSRSDPCHSSDMIPLAIIFDLFSWIRPRSFSISSSPIVSDLALMYHM